MTAPPDLSNITEGEGSAEEEDSADQLRRSLDWRGPLLAQCVLFSLVSTFAALMQKLPQDGFGGTCCSSSRSISPRALYHAAALSAASRAFDLGLDFRFRPLHKPHPPSPPRPSRTAQSPFLDFARSPFGVAGRRRRRGETIAQAAKRASGVGDGPAPNGGARGPGRRGL